MVEASGVPILPGINSAASHDGARTKPFSKQTQHTCKNPALLRIRGTQGHVKTIQACNPQGDAEHLGCVESVLLHITNNLCHVAFCSDWGSGFANEHLLWGSWACQAKRVFAFGFRARVAYPTP